MRFNFEEDLNLDVNEQRFPGAFPQVNERLVELDINQEIRRKIEDRLERKRLIDDLGIEDDLDY